MVVAHTMGVQSSVGGREGSTKCIATVGCRRAEPPDWRTLEYFCEKRQGQGTHDFFYCRCRGAQEGLGTQEKAKFQSNLATIGREEYLGQERYTEGFARVPWGVTELHTMG